MKKECNCVVCGKEVKFGKGYIGSAEYRKLKFCSKECYDSYVSKKPTDFSLTLQLTKFVDEVFEPTDSDERAKLVQDAKECLNDFAMYDESNDGYALNETRWSDQGLEHDVFKYNCKIDVDWLKRVIDYINMYENEDFVPELGLSQVYQYGMSMLEFEAQCKKNEKRASMMPEVNAEIIIHIKPNSQGKIKPKTIRIIDDEDWD